jgi:hypothetical protein
VVVVVVVGVGVVVVVLKEKIKEIHLYIVYSCLQLIVIVTINCLHSYRQERPLQFPYSGLQLLFIVCLIGLIRYSFLRYGVGVALARSSNCD